MRKMFGVMLGVLVTMTAAQVSAQTADERGLRASAHEGRSVGYETWHGYRRWSYGNFGTCNNVQLAAGTCPSYYKR